jgi:hypothetical protein
MLCSSPGVSIADTGELLFSVIYCATVEGATPIASPMSITRQPADGMSVKVAAKPIRFSRKTRRVVANPPRTAGILIMQRLLLIVDSG